MYETGRFLNFSFNCVLHTFNFIFSLLLSICFHTWLPLQGHSVTILTSMHTGPYKNFLQNNKVERDIKKGFWNVFSLSWSRNVYQHKKRRVFCAELWSLKALVERIAACECLCKFSALLLLCWLFEFLSSLILIMSTGKEQTIDSQHLFSVVLNISKVCHWKKKPYICSPGVISWKNDSCYHVKHAPNSFLHLPWIIVGTVWSMIFQLNDIKVVYDRLFRHLWREREN